MKQFIFNNSKTESKELNHSNIPHLKCSECHQCM